MSKAFFFTVAVTNFTDICIENYTSILSGLLQTRYGYTPKNAGFWFEMPYTVAAVMNVILGLFCDKFGYVFPVKFIGCTVMIGAHVL